MILMLIVHGALSNLVKEFATKYERLATMVVPRSSTYVDYCSFQPNLLNDILYPSKLATDDEFTLYAVTIFRKVHDDFVQKCRENR